jgi:hypothetical protein
MAAFMKTVALAGALFTVAGVAAPAAPLDKRDVVWETVTDIVWTTIDVTTTLYPGAATATVETFQTTAEVSPTLHAAHHQHNHYHHQGTTLTTSSSTEAEAEPTTSSTSSTSSTVEAVAAVVTSSSSSEAAAPIVTSSSSEAPTTTAAPIVQAAVESTSTSSTAAAATSSSSSSSSSSGYSGSCAEGSPCVGDITYYDTATLATNPSYCDTTNDGSTELVLALPHGIMTESDCGKTVTITYNGVTKTGTVVDKCMGCDDTSIDLSRALFDVFAAESVGRASGASWYIN